jgi:hypothetical protein
MNIERYLASILSRSLFDPGLQRVDPFPGPASEVEPVLLDRIRRRRLAGWLDAALKVPFDSVFSQTARARIARWAQEERRRTARVLERGEALADRCDREGIRWRRWRDWAARRLAERRNLYRPVDRLAVLLHPDDWRGFEEARREAGYRAALALPTFEDGMEAARYVRTFGPVRFLDGEEALLEVDFAPLGFGDPTPARRFWEETSSAGSEGPYALAERVLTWDREGRPVGLAWVDSVLWAGELDDPRWKTLAGWLGSIGFDRAFASAFKSAGLLSGRSLPPGFARAFAGWVARFGGMGSDWPVAHGEVDYFFLRQRSWRRRAGVAFRWLLPPASWISHRYGRPPSWKLRWRYWSDLWRSSRGTSFSSESAVGESIAGDSNGWKGGGW